MTLQSMTILASIHARVSDCRESQQSRNQSGLGEESETIAQERRQALQKAEELLEDVAQIGGEALGRDHRIIADAEAVRASVYYERTRRKAGEDYLEQYKWRFAEDLERGVVEKRTEMFGPDHPSTLAAKGNLASTLKSTGYVEEAQGLEEAVLEARKRVLGPKHPDTLTAMANLADTYSCIGRVSTLR